MKAKILIAAVAFAALCSCTPQAYTMLLDVRKPSACGADIEGKTVSFIYAEPKTPEDSLFSLCFAEGFAQGLEEKYYSGKKVLDMLTLNPESGVDYYVKDSMVNFVMQTGSDVVIFMDSPVLFYRSDADSIACQVKVYLYDSMDGDDVVRVSGYSGSMPVSKDFAKQAQYAGKSLSKLFMSGVAHEQYTILYYDSVDNSWYHAMEYADALEWSKAMDIWLEMAQRYKGSKLSVIEYNIATACYLCNEYKLASEWLDRSDALCFISLSKGLRTRINSKLQK